MPTPEFVLDLRQKVGNDLLWLSTAMGVVLDARGLVLLGRRSDNGHWSLPGGIIDPAEQPADAAVREIFEETGVAAVPEALTSVGVSAPMTYPNGDRVQYLEYCFRCRAVSTGTGVSDGELVEVSWHPADGLPPMSPHTLRLLTTALEATAAAFAFSGLAAVLGEAATTPPQGGPG